MSAYLDMMRRQAHRRSRGVQFTAKTLLIGLALVCMGASALYWWGVQSQLTENHAIALAFTAILVLAPPGLVSFLIPWSPAGMLLQKINARTIGFTVVIGCALFLFYYSYRIQAAWWTAQPAVADSNLVAQQALIGIIGFIIIPALLWTPVTSEELVEQARQAHLVKRYELQTQADIAILRSTLLRAQEKALIGFANLTVDEREELAGAMTGLVSGIDRTLREIGQSVQAVSGAMMPFEALQDNDDVQEILEYIGGSLMSTRLVDTEDGPAGDRPGVDRPVRMADLDIDDHSVELAPPTRALTTAPIWQLPNVADRTATTHRTRAPHQDTADRAHRTATERPNGSVQRTTSGPLADRPNDRTTERRTPHEQALATARQTLRGAWRRAELEQALSVGKTQAHAYIQAWLASGDIIRLDEPRDHYQFVEAHDAE